jgi:hypothetical protein
MITDSGMEWSVAARGIVPTFEDRVIPDLVKADLAIYR